jgi:hypothetical protein
MEDTTMTKKEYMNPTMQVVKIQQNSQLLAGSLNAYGVNDELIEEEVNEAFSRELDLMNLFGE